MVLKSTSSCPRRAAERSPSFPATTSSRAAGVATQVQATSTPAISWAGVSATFTPRGSRAVARARERFHTVTWKPLVARFFAMPRPINPSPRNPTRCPLAMRFALFRGKDGV